MSPLFVYIVSAAALLKVVWAASLTPSPTNTSISSTPVPSLDERCAKAVSNESDADDNCNSCVSAEDGQCYYCYVDKSCRGFFTTNIFHTPKECAYTQARIWNCSINLQVMAITLMSAFGVLLLLILCCCCYCCCCRRSEGTTRWKKELKRLEDDRKRRKEQADERRKEREARYEEIRRKYGLNDSKPGYKRM